LALPVFRQISNKTRVCAPFDLAAQVFHEPELGRVGRPELLVLIGE
jgi:hypothetical protein